MLARTALRLATLEALRPTAALPSGPWPTIAGAAVFDSRVDPIEDLKIGENQPVVCVYTEDDEGSSGQARGGPPFRQVVELCFELSIVARVPSGSDPTVYAAGIPETDAELEASLDLLEAQIRFICFYGPTGTLWRTLTHRKVTAPSSRVSRSSEEAVRLAQRRVSWKTEVLDDCFDPAPATNPAGFDRLPEPLQTVVKALASTAYGYKIGTGLAVAAPVMPLAEDLEKVTLNETVAPGAAPINAEVDGLDQ
jgi:hypothetical protein